MPSKEMNDGSSQSGEQCNAILFPTYIEDLREIFRVLSRCHFSAFD